MNLLNLLNIVLNIQALVVSRIYGSIQSRSEHIKRGWEKVASFVAIFWNVTQRYFSGSAAWHGILKWAPKKTIWGRKGGARLPMHESQQTSAAVRYHIVSLRCDNPFSPNRISESLDDAILEL